MSLLSVLLLRSQILDLTCNVFTLVLVAKDVNILFDELEAVTEVLAKMTTSFTLETLPVLQMMLAGWKPGRGKSMPFHKKMRILDPGQN